MDGNDSDTSDDFFVINTKKDRLKLFWKLYWRTIVIISSAIIFLPVVFIGQNRNAYVALYIFILCCIFWSFDVLHPGVVGLLPTVLTTVFWFSHDDFIAVLHVHNGVVNILGVMMAIVAIEYSNVHRRIALKLLLIFGCNHYRLSFLLFFTCMISSMFLTNTMACGLMIPTVKAILFELEKMGILDVYHNITKGKKQKYTRHELSNPRPTDFTIFYFLGIAYSSSIGGLANLLGSQTNEIYKVMFERIFPLAPKMDFPHYMLLNLPGILIMEALVYLWMNVYFMGLFRAQSEIALAIGMTEDEAQYIQTLLSREYKQLGRLNFHEIIVIIAVGVVVILQLIRSEIYLHKTIVCPVILSTFLFFIAPVNLECLKFFKKKSALIKESNPSTSEPFTNVSPNLFPTSQTKGCLSWSMIREEIHWAVLFIVAGSCTLMEAMTSAGTMVELERALLLMKNWPTPAMGLAVILICKFLTEYANNSCLLYAILPSIAKLSIEAKVNPHYLMTAADMACSLPFHLVAGTPVLAMVCEYMRIPPWKMIQAGLGPTLIAICSIWFTVGLWARTIWTDLGDFPSWAEHSMLDFNEMPSNRHTNHTKPFMEQF